MNKLEAIQFNTVAKHKINYFISNGPHLIKHVSATCDSVMNKNHPLMIRQLKLYITIFWLNDFSKVFILLNLYTTKQYNA